MSTTRKPYRELQRKLILAFDVGTTFSGASFALLDPGRVPTIKGVTRFPGQQETGGNSKIPSVICYDNSGKILSVGQEAVGMHPEEVEDDEDDEDSETWNTVQRIVKVEWFKLHLRPKALSAAHLTDEALPPLPFNKTAIEVFGDFLGYLYRCTRNFFEESMLSGKETWEAIEASGNIEFILTHPNGWEGPQQAQMREAAVRAGLVTDISASRKLIQFVSEGEASLHFCINEGVVTRERLPADDGVIIIDAGGGTIDLSAYKRSSTDESFVEIAKTACILQGSVMVSRRAKAWLRENLQGSKYVNEIEEITSSFDSGAKLTFRNPLDPSFIRFGSVRDRDPKFDIKSGQKKIPGSVVASFFGPSIQETVQAVQKQRREAGESIKAALLVGGFAANDWVFSELKSSLESVGITLARPDGHVNKAVADRAISFYLDHFVSARVSKMSYGVKMNVLYRPKQADHLRRSGTVFRNAAGEKRIPAAYSEILPKSTQVSETKEYRESFYRTATSRTGLVNFVEYVSCYRGEQESPGWTDEEPDLFSTACTIRSNAISETVLQLAPKHRKYGQPYFEIHFEVILVFGLTELKAQIAWKDSNGKEQRSPAEVIYDDD